MSIPRQTRSLYALLALLLVLGLAPPLAPAPGARAQAAAPLEDAVQQHVAAETGDDPDAITVTTTAEDGDWAYGTATAPGGTVSFFLAHRQDGAWQVALRYTEAFDAMLANAPPDFPTPEIRASLEGFTIAGDGSSNLSFPYPVGAIRDFSDAYEINKISFFTHRPNQNPGWRSPTAAFPVLAMRGGIAYRPCDGLVMIDHGDGWATYYAYVGSISVTNGQAVTRGQQLGVTSSAPGCAGTGYGDEVLVWLTHYGQLQDLNGIDIGGYTITTSEGGVNGSWTCLGRGDSGGDCTMYPYPNGIVNDGEQGTTAYPNAKFTLDQNFPNLFQIVGFPANTLVTLTWQRPDGSQVQVGSVKTNPVGAASGAYITPETSASEYPFPNLLIAQAGTLARSVRSNAPSSTMQVEGAGYGNCGPGQGFCVITGQQITVTGTALTRNLVLTPSFLDHAGTRHPLPGTVTTSTLGRLNYTFTVPEYAAEGFGELQFRDATNYVWTSASLGVTYQPVLLLSSSRGPGGSITARLRNADPNLSVQLRATGDVILGQGTTDANGALDLAIILPPGSDYTDIYVFTDPGLVTVATARYWYELTLVVAPASVAPGGAATLDVRGAPANRTITAHWFNGSTWAQVTSGVTNDTGALSQPFTVPAGAAPGSTLTLRITVDGWYGYSFASVNISGGSSQPLVANAGPDQTTTAPTSSGKSITLNGSGSTPAASIVSYVWTRAGQQIATGASASATIPVGVHDIVLTVTDNQGRVATDTMIVTITLTNPPSATLNPTSATPGTTINFTLANFPANTTVEVLPPSILGAPEPITTVQTNGSGAASGSFTAPNAPTGTMTFTFRTPTASASANLTVTAGISFATSSIKRNASVEINGAGFPAATPIELAWLDGSTWRPITHTGGSSDGSGIVWVPFTVPAAIPAGERQFRVTVGTVSAQTTVQVVLSEPPIADAGQDDTYAATSPQGASVPLYGGYSYDPDGSITSYVWKEGATQIATGVSPTVTLAVGVHTITLTVTDNSGVTATDTVVITIVNEPPVADAGEDASYQLTAGQTTVSLLLDGSWSYDPDGSIASYVWKEGSTQIATGEQPTVSLNAGTHTITLTVTDNAGATDTDTVVITVSAPNSPPVANAGPDQTVQASGSTASVTLNGTGSTAPGSSITGYVWKEGSTQIATGAQPTVSLPVGTHTLTLTVTAANGLTASDTVVITVTAPAQPPVANAGSDQTVQASGSTASVTLNGTGSTAPGSSITGYVWKNGATQIATGSQPTVSLPVGSHTLTLVVTAANGLTDDDTVVITVTAPASPPVANAGPDQTVQTGGSTASVTLNGTGSTAPGSSITSYVWRNGATQIATGAQPTVSLPVGTHTLTLTVTAANSLTASDTVVITVNRISTTPTVTLSTVRTTVNSWVTYTISGYPANASVQITWKRLSGSTIDMGTAQTDASGFVTGRFRVPATPGGPNQSITFSAGTTTKTLLFEVAPRIKSNTNPGVRGQQVDISLRGYARQEVVRIRWWNPTTSKWVELARITTSNSGSANVMITVPSWAPDGNNSVRGDGTVFRQQTNAVKIAGGAFRAASVETPTPTPTATPTATPLVVDGTARPADAPWSPVAITDDTGADLLLTMTDGDVTTTWTADPARERATLTVDLGQAITLTAIGWLPGAAPDGGCGTLSAIEQSTDGVTWTPVDPAREPGALGAPGVWQVQAAGGEARFVRWTVTAQPDQAQPGCLAELAVWGMAIEPATPEPTATPAEEPTATETPTAVATEAPVETPVATETPAEPITPEEPAAEPTTAPADAPAEDAVPAEETPASQ